MSRNCWIFLMLAGFVLISQAQGFGLVKKKLKAAALPFVAAKLAVASDVKAKLAAATEAKLAAVKAKGAALKAVALAPVVLTKKVVGVKLGALKAVKALKLAKLAKVKKLLAAKKASRIIIPTGPIAVIPIKTVPSSVYGHPLAAKVQSFVPQGLVRQFLSGAQSTLEAVGNKVPFLQTFQNGLSNAKLYPASHPVEVSTPGPSYLPPSNNGWSSSNNGWSSSNNGWSSSNNGWSSSNNGWSSSNELPSYEYGVPPAPVEAEPASHYVSYRTITY